MDTNLFKHRSTIWDKINNNQDKVTVNVKNTFINDKSKVASYTHVKKVADRGRTSKVEILSKGKDSNVFIVKKQYLHSNKPFGDYAQPYNAEESFKSEVTALLLLHGWDHFPQLLYYDENTLTLYMTYCGKDLGKEKNLPNNWREQMRNIYKGLQATKIYNNDIYEGNFCLHNGKIYMIDFGFAKSHIDLNYKNLALNDIEEAFNFKELLRRIHDRSKMFLSAIHGVKGK